MGVCRLPESETHLLGGKSHFPVGKSGLPGSGFLPGIALFSGFGFVPGSPARVRSAMRCGLQHWPLSVHFLIRWHNPAPCHPVTLSSCHPRWHAGKLGWPKRNDWRMRCDHTRSKFTNFQIRFGDGMTRFILIRFSDGMTRFIFGRSGFNLAIFG